MTAGSAHALNVSSWESCMTRLALRREGPSSGVLATRSVEGLGKVAVCALALVACSPTVKVEAPKEPITINLNVKADVVVTLKETAQEDIQANPGVF